jgi:iron complex outermembrane receptor protein
MIAGGLAALSCGLGIASEALAQNVAAEGQSKERAAPRLPREALPADEAVSEVLVTGSLIRGLPQEYLASPIFTHDRSDLVRSGAGSVSEYMLTIPQNFTGDLSEFATTGAGIGSPLGDATSYNQYDGFAGFALRGLASDATLTLLNGRRMPSVGMSEAPTVSTIPAMLIERIDIIPDGASATYGADAVAGVVNIVTRRPTHGVELEVRGGTATQVDRKDLQIGALTGHSWDSGSVYGMAMFQKRSPLVGKPVEAQGETLQITQLPNERLVGLYAGGQQRFGDVTVSLDASHFQRDRDSKQLYLDEPQYNRAFKTRTRGSSIYSGAHWQGEDRTSLDLTVDYHRNQTDNAVGRMGRAPKTQQDNNTLFVSELRGQTAVARLPAGPVLAAAGLQYREETLRTDATIFFNRSGGVRKVKSVFGEINAPIVSAAQNVPLIRSLSLTAAARYEDLGFDSAFAPKVGLRWQVDRSIALRGTYARSFLAPRFRSTIGIAEQVSFGIYDYGFLDPKDQNPALPSGQALVMYRAGANPELKTQNADTLTLGVDYTPTFAPGLTVKADYYRIKISDRIGTPSPTDSLSVADLQVFNIAKPTPEQIRKVLDNPAVFRRFAEVPGINDGELTFFDSANPAPPSLLSQVQVIADIRAQNFAVESTDGFDLDLTYGAEVLGGAMTVNLSGQYILNLKLKAGGSTAISRLDGYAKPADLRLNGTIVWGRDGFSIGSVVNYIDGYTDDRAGGAGGKIGSFATASLFFGLDLDRWSSKPWLADSEVQVVVANVFNRQPPRVIDGVVGFDPYNNPPNPRTIGVVVRKRFG